MLFDARACAVCHSDPHKFAESYKETCETCHTTQKWNNVLAFDHKKTQFALDGAHQKAACTACHKDKDTKWALAALKSWPEFSPWRVAR